MTDLDAFDAAMVHIDDGSTDHGGRARAAIKVTGMPGKHVPPGVLGTLNDMAGAVPPTNGWMIELGMEDGPDEGGASFKCGYR